VERIRAQGRVNKKLERLELEGSESPAPGSKMTVEGRDAEITSAIYSPHFGKVIALAYVRTS
jgi:glycine cleavage system aminomethyltransferase T